MRGKQAVHNDIGIILMSMNLTKLAIEARRKAKVFHDNSRQTKDRKETIRYLIDFTVIFYLVLVISPPGGHIKFLFGFSGSLKNIGFFEILKLVFS